MGKGVDDDQALAIACTRRGDDLFALTAASQHLQSAPGCESLPAASAAAHAERTVRLDHHMADLTCEAVRAALQRATHHQSPADAGPERDEYDVVETLCGTVLPLGQDCAGRVVVDCDRVSEHACQQRPDGDLAGADQIGRCAQHARPCDQPRHAHAERVVWAELASEVCQCLHDVDTPVRCGSASFGDNFAAFVEHDPEKLGPADIDAG